jgi:predicted GH43/DUF377 family glycosyl hydrolase
MGVLDSESLFEKSIAEPLEDARQYKNINLIVGIPFYNEVDTLPLVLRMVADSLVSMKISDKALIICAGDPAGEKALEAVKNMKLQVPHMQFLMLEGGNGRGMSIRALLELAEKLETDLAILPADIIGKGAGLQPGALQRMLKPLQYGYDLVLTSFRRQYFEDLLGKLFLGPLLETFYGYRISDTISGTYAISHDMVEEYCADIKFWVDHTQGFGIDPWLITTAIIQQRRICEVPLGFRMEYASLDKVTIVFKDFAAFMFESILREEEYWKEKRIVLRSPDICGLEPHQDVPVSQTYETRALIHFFRNGFNQYRDLLATACPHDMYSDLERSVISPTRDFHLGGKTWANTVYSLLSHYRFAPDANKKDVLEALTAVYCGRMGGFLEHLEVLQDDLTSEKSTYASSIISSRAESMKDEQRRYFLHGSINFIRQWKEKSWKYKPPLIPADYLEFIPGKPIVLPKSIKWRREQEIWTADLFNRLQTRYSDKFHDFMEDDLHISADSSSKAITSRLEEYMEELEEIIDKLFPGNVYTEEGTREAVEAIFQSIDNLKFFGIKEEIFEKALTRFHPLNIMIPEGCHTPRDLFDKMLPRDAVTLANLIETRKWADRILLWILDNLTPEDMEDVELKPLVLGESFRNGTFKLGKISDLNKLTTRQVISPLSKGIGGKYPKLRFFLFIGRQIMITQNYSFLYKTYARERKKLGLKIRNSLIGRFESTPFSAYNIFENYHHRELIRMVRILAQKMTLTGHGNEAQMLKAMCDGYGVSQVLEDGTFVPCSAWSWASYSSKGGTGIPTAMSSHVEERWFNHDLLEEIHAELGFDPGDILQRITQSIGDGKADDDLLDVLLGIKSKDVTVVAQEIQDYPPAKPLVRYPGNPILNPIKDNPWESKYVLNAAALRIKDKVYLLYRAYGDDEVSRIGLAVTDGYHVLERLPDPIFAPQTEQEKKGVEDPRVVIIGDRVYMMYTAYDGVIAQIAAASISIDDFINKKFYRWKREGLAFKDIWNKDAFLFPEKINGKYIIYHRIEPSIWVSYMDNLEFPVPKEGHSIIMGPRPGKMWDFLKIGAGSQPIKTKYGWLMIYHGVDKERVYRLGVMLVPLDEPERVIYRSPNPRWQRRSPSISQTKMRFSPRFAPLTSS